jgi:sodium/hydrogen antiporter
MLLLFGGSLVHGILNHLTLQTALFGLLFVLVIRPVLGMLSLIGTDLHIKEKLAISFFGIRGMGSFYYLAFALHEAKFSNGDELWSIVSFIVLLSILIHGLTATSVIKKLEHQFAKEEPLEEIKTFKTE